MSERASEREKMHTWLLSLSDVTRNVGSSFWNLFSARIKLASVRLFLLAIASEITGSGTCIELCIKVVPRSSCEEARRDDPLGACARNSTNHRDGHRAIGKGVARVAVDSEHGANLAGTDRLHLLHLVRVHTNESRHLALLLCDSIHKRAATCQRS